MPTPEATERIAFFEESAPQRHIRLTASGIIDEPLLDALAAFVNRQRNRLILKEPEPQFPDEGI